MSLIFYSLKIFLKIKRLNVSFTGFNDHSLDVISQELVYLELLDMSSTRVANISPLVRLKNTMKFLYMYNMSLTLTDEIIAIICSMTKLQQIDLSCDISSQIFAETFSMFNVNVFLTTLASAQMKDLNYLDISGKTKLQKEPLMYNIFFRISTADQKLYF